LLLPSTMILPLPGSNSATLRHTCASLLLKESRYSPLEIADALEHGLRMLFERYSHDLAEYRGQQIDVDQLIAQARQDARFPR
jgi:hypothetical protein